MKKPIIIDLTQFLPAQPAQDEKPAADTIANDKLSDAIQVLMEHLNENKSKQ